MRWSLSVCLLGLVASAGCGESPRVVYKVSGKVTYQGKPLPLGTVTVVPSDGEAAIAMIQPSGDYSLEVTPGNHQVAIMAIPPQTGGRPDPTMEGGMDMTGVPVPKPLIPDKYNRFDTSGLTIDVKPIAENKIDIELK